jgi:hypothetical protein
MFRSKKEHSVSITDPGQPVAKTVRSMMGAKKKWGGDIDVWIDTQRFYTPPGGEFVVDAAETYEYPVEPASPERLARLQDALQDVLKSERQHPGVRAAFQKLVIEAVEGAANEQEANERLDRLVDEGEYPHDSLPA